jgi:hypothetical protein
LPRATTGKSGRSTANRFIACVCDGLRMHANMLATRLDNSLSADTESADQERAVAD